MTGTAPREPLAQLATRDDEWAWLTTSAPVMHTASTTLDAIGLRDLADRWQCSVTSIRRKIGRGLLPVVVLPGSTRQLVPTAAVEAAEKPRLAPQPRTTPQTAA